MTRMKVSVAVFVFAVLLCPVSGAQGAGKTQPEKELQQQPTTSEQAESATQQAQALLTLSEQQNQGNHALALQTAQQALQLWQASPDNAGRARAYAQVAQCHFAQSDLTEATQNYESALQIWRDLNDPREQAEILIMLSYIEARKGEWQSSISFLTQAQSLIEEKNEPFLMGQIANGLGDIFNENGLPENALIQYQRALDYFRQTPDGGDLFTVWAIGDAYYLKGDYPEALSHLDEALAGFDPKSLGAAVCHQSLGRVYGAMGEPVAALQHLESALAIYSRSNNPKESAQVLGLMGQMYQQQGRRERARQYYDQALLTFIKLDDRINLAAVYFALGQLELKNKKYAAAENYLQQSIKVTENIRRVPASSDLTAAFSATVYERYEKYIECLMRQYEAHPEEGLAVRAFATSEAARARSLTELLQATQTDLVPGLDPTLAAQEKSLRQALQVKEDYKVARLGGRYKKEELDALEQELSRLEAQYKQVLATIQARYPSYTKISQPVAWDLRDIQEQVIADDQTMILEYSLGTDKSYVWAVTRQSLKSYELPAKSQIEEAAAKAHRWLESSPGSDTGEGADAATGEQAIAQLSRMILSPVAAELNKHRIIVVADGALNYIPFQVLPSPSNHEPLVAGYEVVNAPSASILGELRQASARRQPAKLLAAFGAPVFNSNYAQRKAVQGGWLLAALQTLGTERWRGALRDIELKGDSFDPSTLKPLFYAKRELDNLVDVTSSEEAFVALDFAATREQLLNTDLTQYAILHFATHGLLDPARPEISGLVLSTVNRDGQALNGFVGLQDIYQLRAPVDLVVLSACRTGLGRDVRGEGLLGLTRGFMYAGASSVVASLWSVDDEATAELMKQFYANMLQRGMTPAAALRAAQNSIRQKPEWSSPHYWAAFTLQGEYGKVIKPAPAAGTKPWQRKLMSGAALLTLLLVSVAYLYRRRRSVRTAQASA